MQLKDAKRIIIKIGSALLVEQTDHQRHADWLTSIAEDIAALKSQDKEIIIVTSGSVGLGCKSLGIDRQELKIEEKQAIAACGQTLLIQQYQQYLDKHDVKVAQILLNIEDSENRRRYLNARTTIDTLLEMGIIPIINENDTVATDEIRFSDNDVLAARVAQMVSADVLVLLSDIDGLYSADPNMDKNAEFIAEVPEINEKIEAIAGDSASIIGTGGMASKVAAAKITVGAGCHLIVAKGSNMHPISTIEQGGKCTWFIANETPLSSRKYWIATSLHAMGEVIIDKGAVKALRDNNSLLPIGVKDITGNFQRGDAILVKDETGEVIGKGLSAYDSNDALRIKGNHSREIETLLGYSGRKELIHKDDFALDTGMINTN